MKKLTLLFLIAVCYGQVLPTVPANMFRITLENYSLSGELDFKEQEFNMRGIGRSYFDDRTKNELGFYSGSNDLYHVGDLFINEFVIKVIGYIRKWSQNWGYFVCPLTFIALCIFKQRISSQIL